MDGQGTKCRRNRPIAENLNRLSRAHERYRRQTDRRTGDSISRTFANKTLLSGRWVGPVKLKAYSCATTQIYTVGDSYCTWTFAAPPLTLILSKFCPKHLWRWQKQMFLDILWRWLLEYRFSWFDTMVSAWPRRSIPAGWTDGRWQYPYICVMQWRIIMCRVFNLQVMGNMRDVFGSYYISREA